MKYIKHAFLNRWNLLLFGGAIVAGWISAAPDIFLPLAAAVEILYLSILSTRPAFKSLIDSAELAANENPMADKSRDLLEALSPDDRKQFIHLKSLCLQLQQIAVKRDYAMEKASDDFIEEVKLEGINQLLWIFLKLLYSKSSLERYFRAVKRDDILAGIEETARQVDALGSNENDTADAAKRRESLMDTLTTSQSRLQNYDTAVRNHDFIGVELKRLYTKITTLAEMGINRQDPRLVMHEIDVATSTIQQTEEAMKDLDGITGMSLHDMKTPDILEIRYPANSSNRNRMAESRRLRE